MKMGTGRQNMGGGDGMERPGAHTAGVGKETGYDTVAWTGNPTDNSPLHGAVKELHSQHPERYDDMGPHQGGKSHMRHEALAGLHPKSSHKGSR